MTSKPARRFAALAASLALAGGLAACGGDDHAGHDSQSGAAQPSSSASTPAAGATSPSATTASAVDAAFVRQMIPHHQGAVAMARIAERKAEHDEIKTLAGQIITAQERELTELDALAKEFEIDVADADAYMAADAETLGLSMDEMGMSMQHGALDEADPFDLAFISEMVAHHEGAIAMAQAQFKDGRELKIRELSDAIISAQQREVIQMTGWREDWYPAGPAGQDKPADQGAHKGHGG